jgi:hypothetical protein
LTKGNGVFGSETFLTKPLYTVNLTTGVATLLGPVAVSGTLRDIAVAAVPEPSSALVTVLGVAMTMFVGRRRT